MIQLSYTIRIQAPVHKVYDIMLGLTKKTTYETWTAEFNPTSTYEGNWNKGSKMLFVGVAENGDKGGMVSEIIEHIPHSFVSIKHYGLLKGTEEITEGPEVEQWANGLENYTFTETAGTTEVTVQLDCVDDFVSYMNTAYPKALKNLKEICE